jgi:hypothetical protein
MIFPASFVDAERDAFSPPFRLAMHIISCPAGPEEDTITNTTRTQFLPCAAQDLLLCATRACKYNHTVALSAAYFRFVQIVNDRK